MKRRPTQLEFALLGIVAPEPKSAYTVRKLFVDTPMRQFSSSPGSIYPALERLHADGLLSGRDEPGDRGRTRRVYSLTPRGRQRLRAWLAELPTREELANDVGSVFLRFSLMAGHLDDAEVVAFLDALEPLLIEYRDVMRKYVKQFRDQRARHAELGARNGVITFDGHLRWLREARERFRAAT